MNILIPLVEGIGIACIVLMLYLVCRFYAVKRSIKNKPGGQQALDDYWNANTREEERIAYAKLMALGMKDAYK